MGPARLDNGGKLTRAPPDGFDQVEECWIQLFPQASSTLRCMAEGITSLLL